MLRRCRKNISYLEIFVVAKDTQLANCNLCGEHISRGEDQENLQHYELGLPSKVQASDNFCKYIKLIEITK